jgi:3',5'-cyclic-nucleotide phosphodiesterase
MGLARIAAIIVAAWCFTAPAAAGDGFSMIALGSLGGIQDGNLSAYLIRPRDDDRAVTCDAGTLVNGLRVADEKGALADIKVPADNPNSRVGYALSDKIKGYLISHAHLDHVAGLIVASPDDAKKPIYALASINSALVETYFNWQAWPNFSDRGKAPQLKRYALQDLKPGSQVPIADTKMTVTAFPLSHGGVESTAFLIESDGDALLCFGDTGPDAVEKAPRMHDIWRAVADRVKQRKLRAVLIESSYTSDRPDNLLFGHLTPKWLLRSLRELDQLAGGNALKDLPVVVTHIKYSLTEHQPQDRMLQELQRENDAGVRFIIPEQGKRWEFR